MAFEAFLDAHAGRTSRPRRRRLTYTLSLAVHGAALAAAIAYSFWRVDELSPPTVKVTFMSSAPPAPAPPPPPAGGGAEVKKKAEHKPRPVPTALVQPSVIPPKQEVPPPRDEPRSQPASNDHDDDDDDRGFAGGQPGGRVGGSIGGRSEGTVGGTVGGAGPAPPGGAPKMLAPQMGALQKSGGADPDFPPVLRRPGRSYLVMAKICVSRAGAVDSVTILQGADAQLDRNVVSAVKTWRYRPLLANDTAVPFCYFGRFEFKSPE